MMYTFTTVKTPNFINSLVQEKQIEPQCLIYVHLQEITLYLNKSATEELVEKNLKLLLNTTPSLLVLKATERVTDNLWIYTLNKNNETRCIENTKKIFNKIQEKATLNLNITAFYEKDIFSDKDIDEYIQQSGLCGKLVNKYDFLLPAYSRNLSTIATTLNLKNIPKIKKNKYTVEEKILEIDNFYLYIHKHKGE